MSTQSTVEGSSMATGASRSLLEIQDLPNRGRGYVATQDIPARTLIHVSLPLSTVVSQEWMPETCMSCFMFSYPKKMKVKALSTTEETHSLLDWWQKETTAGGTKQRNSNKSKNNIPLRNVLFCTDQCKQKYLSTCSNDEWYRWLTCMYRLENHDPSSSLLLAPTHTTSARKNEICQEQPQQRRQKQQQEQKGSSEYMESIDIFKSDIDLQNYLDRVWDLATACEDHDAEWEDLDNTDFTMLRFIASCLVKRSSSTKDDMTICPKSPGFDLLWNMQDNELTYFRHCYQLESEQRQRQRQQLQQQQERQSEGLSSSPLSTPVLSPSLSSTTSCSSSSCFSSAPVALDSLTDALDISSPLQPINWKKDLPEPIQQHIRLYRRFVAAMTTPMKFFHREQVPIILSPEADAISHALFRAIYYREMANSFGLWEQASTSSQPSEEAASVTDDLELLGFGIYPSAVYFNHSCHANAIKLRHGREMHFYTKQHINQGDEVCISYGDVSVSLKERRQRLLDHYHFLCTCPRCVSEEQQITVMDNQRNATTGKKDV